MYSSPDSLDDFEELEDDEVLHSTRPWDNLPLILADNTPLEEKEGHLAEW